MDQSQTTKLQWLKKKRLKQKAQQVHCHIIRKLIKFKNKLNNVIA